MQDAEKKVDRMQIATNGYGFAVREKDSNKTREDFEYARAKTVRVIQEAIACQAYH